MVPSWTPDPPAEDAQEPGPGDEGAPDEPASPEPNVPSPAPATAPLAPAGRFRGARRALGEYARSGDSNEMRRGLGHYVRTGYGGSATATRRFGGTAQRPERSEVLSPAEGAYAGVVRQEAGDGD